MLLRNDYEVTSIASTQAIKPLSGIISYVGAASLGVFLASRYDNKVLQILFFALPILAMAVAHRRSHLEPNTTLDHS